MSKTSYEPFKYYNEAIQTVNQCKKYQKVLIAGIGNDLGSHSYASNSIQPTGMSPYVQPFDYCSVLGVELPIQPNLCLIDLYGTPVLANAVSHNFSSYIFDHMSDNVSKSMLAVQPQYGDESPLVPKLNNSLYTNATNTTNTYQTLEYSDKQSWGPRHRHQVIILQPLITDAIIQNIHMGGHDPGSPTLAFIHPHCSSRLRDYYAIDSNYGWCPCPKPLTCPLQVSHTVQIIHNLASREANVVSDVDRMLAKQAHRDFYLDYNCQRLYNVSYESHIVNVIDELIARSENVGQKMDPKVQFVDMGHTTDKLQPCANTYTVAIGSIKVKHLVNKNPGRGDTFMYVDQFTQRGLEIFLGSVLLVTNVNALLVNLV